MADMNVNAEAMAGMGMGMEALLAAWPERRITALRVRLVQVAAEGEATPLLLATQLFEALGGNLEADAAVCAAIEHVLSGGDEHMRDVWERLNREPEIPAPLTAPSEAA